MRICILKATKRILEMQSHATEGTLLQNAVSAGFKVDKIEEREVDEVGYAAALAEDQVEIAATAAVADQAAVKALIEAAISAALPTWSTVKAGINNAFPDAKQNQFMTILCKAIYGHVTGKRPE
jgi:hypothetical protein